MEAIKLIRCSTRSTQVSRADNNIQTNCLSISFYNQSPDSRDPVTGASVGYRMIIDNAYSLVPGQSISFNAPSGFYLGDVHAVAFVAVTGTPGGDKPVGVISRIETEIDDLK